MHTVCISLCDVRPRSTGTRTLSGRGAGPRGWFRVFDGAASGALVVAGRRSGIIPLPATMSQWGQPLNALPPNQALLRGTLEVGREDICASRQMTCRGYCAVYHTRCRCWNVRRHRRWTPPAMYMATVLIALALGRTGKGGSGNDGRNTQSARPDVLGPTDLLHLNEKRQPEHSVVTNSSVCCCTTLVSRAVNRRNGDT